MTPEEIDRQIETLPASASDVDRHAVRQMLLDGDADDACDALLELRSRQNAAEKAAEPSVWDTDPETGMMYASKVGLQPGRDHAVCHGGAPISKSLPRRPIREGQPDVLDGHQVLRYKDGGYSTRTGQPIVRNRQDSENELSRTKCVRE